MLAFLPFIGVQAAKIEGIEWSITKPNFAGEEMNMRVYFSKVKGYNKEFLIDFDSRVDVPNFGKIYYRGARLRFYEKKGNTIFIEKSEEDKLYLVVVKVDVVPSLASTDEKAINDEADKILEKYKDKIASDLINDEVLIYKVVDKNTLVLQYESGESEAFVNADIFR